MDRILLFFVPILTSTAAVKDRTAAVLEICQVKSVQQPG
jgi:hypothetical protein